MKNIFKIQKMFGPENSGGRLNELISQIINPNSRLKAEDLVDLTNEAQKLANDQGLNLNELIQDKGFYSVAPYFGKGEGATSGVAMKDGIPVYVQDNAGVGHGIKFRRK